MSLTKKVQTLNHYIFLLIALFVMFLVVKEVAREVFRDDYEPPKVQVVDEATQNNATINYSKHFITQANDAYIFAIKADKIVLDSILSDPYHSQSSSGIMNMFSGGYDDRNTVNFLFARENQTPVLLFEQHYMISDYILFDDSDKAHSHKLNKNVYLVIMEDSNSDGYLSEDDRQDVFISDYDGSDLKPLLSDVSSFSLRDDNLLYLTVGSGITKQVYFYRVDEDRLLLLDTALAL